MNISTVPETVCHRRMNKNDLQQKEQNIHIKFNSYKTIHTLCLCRVLNSERMRLHSLCLLPFGWLFISIRLKFFSRHSSGCRLLGECVYLRVCVFASVCLCVCVCVLTEQFFVSFISICSSSF